MHIWKIDKYFTSVHSGDEHRFGKFGFLCDFSQIVSPPENVVFFDDHLEYLSKANKLGITTVAVESSTAFNLDQFDYILTWELLS